MPDTLLHIFDTTDGTDGAPCVARLGVPPTKKRERDGKGGVTMVDLPPFDPAVHIGTTSAVGIESSAHEGNSLQELLLNADGVTIDIAPGFSAVDQLKVARIRAVIAEPLLDAIGRCVVEIAAEPAVSAVMTPEGRRLVAKISDLLRVSNITDGPDLDEASGEVDEVEAILAARPAIQA